MSKPDIVYDTGHDGPPPPRIKDCPAGCDGGRIVIERQPRDCPECLGLGVIPKDRNVYLRHWKGRAKKERLATA